MMKSTRPTVSLWRDIVLVIVLVALALVVSSFAPQGHVAYSVETKFADASRAGLAIVPASCPSDPHIVGECDPPATASYTASYTTSYTATYIPATASYIPAEASYGPLTASYTPTESSYGGTTASYGGVTGSYPPVTPSYPPSGLCWDGSAPDAAGSCPACPTGYTKVGNTCVPPDNNPQFIGFPTTQGFNASGHLEVRPSLVRSGDTTHVYWNVMNVRDCTVRGSNGDGTAGSVTGAWDSLGSGASGKVTSPITSRTDYTLFCHSLTGATPSTITETRTVNVIPAWYEPSGGN